MVLLTPFSQGTHLLSVGRLIVVGDQAYHRCVISKFDDDIGAVCSCTVVCVQGVQEWAEDAALRCTSVEDEGGKMISMKNFSQVSGPAIAQKLHLLKLQMTCFLRQIKAASRC